MRTYATRARASWVDDDGRDRCPPLSTSSARLDAPDLEVAAAFAAGRLEAAHDTLTFLDAGYPPLDEATVTVDVKRVR